MLEEYGRSIIEYVDKGIYGMYRSGKTNLHCYGQAERLYSALGTILEHHKYWKYRFYLKGRFNLFGLVYLYIVSFPENY